MKRIFNILSIMVYLFHSSSYGMYSNLSRQARQEVRGRVGRHVMQGDAYARPLVQKRMSHQNLSAVLAHLRNKTSASKAIPASSMPVSKLDQSYVQTHDVQISKPVQGWVDYFKSFFKSKETEKEYNSAPESEDELKGYLAQRNLPQMRSDLELKQSSVWYQEGLKHNVDLIQGADSKKHAIQNQVKLLNVSLDNAPIDIDALDNRLDNIIHCELDHVDIGMFASFADAYVLPYVLNERYKKMQRAFLQLEGIDINTYMAFREWYRSYVTTNSLKNAYANRRHDEALGVVLKITKMLLQKYGIHPDAVSIELFNEDEEAKGGTAIARGPRLNITLGAENKEGMRPIEFIETAKEARIAFSKKFIEKMEKVTFINAVVLEWTIRHEITHILLHHSIDSYILESVYTYVQKDGEWYGSLKANSEIAEGMDAQRKALTAMIIREQELQADIMPMLHNKMFAQKVSKAFMAITSQEKEQFGKRPALYQSYDRLLLWNNAILRAWQKVLPG